MEEEVFTFVKNEDESLLSTMKKLYDSNEFNDVKLKVGDTLFPAHKAVLYHSSLMLRKLLTSETADKDKEVIEVKGVELEYFKELLLYMYTNRIEIKPKDIIGILSTADYFQIDEVKQFCLSALRKCLCAENALGYFQCGRLYDDQELIENAVNLIHKNLSSLKSDLNECEFADFESMFNNLPQTMGDGERYTFLKEWVEHDLNDRKRYFVQLVKSFDYNNMSNAHLKLMAVDDLMKQHPNQREPIIEIILKAVEDLEARRNEEEKFKGTFKYTFNEVKDMENGSNIFSDSNTYIAGVPWTIWIRKSDWEDDIEHLGFFSHCYKGDGFRKAAVKYTLKSSVEDLTKQGEQHTYGHGLTSRGYQTFIKWEDLMNEDLGYLSADGSITLQLDIEVHPVFDE